MARFGEDPSRVLDGLESELVRDDPRFVRALGSGDPCEPREYRFGPVWLLFGIAAASLAAGIVVKQVLFLVAGVVLVSTAIRLYDIQREQITTSRNAAGGASAEGSRARRVDRVRRVRRWLSSTRRRRPGSGPARRSRGGTGNRS